MEPFIIDTKTIVLLLTTLLTGLLAGIFFTWSNAITPGIGRLDDINYLRAFQNMNRAIVNPLFLIIIMGPVFLSFATSYLYKSHHSYILWLLLIAAILYFVGVFLVTIMGNIPLNNLLDKTDLTNISLEDARILRDKFELKWNNLHLVRTITSALSFLLLIMACLFRNSNF
ncbi:DUF1772 domain-containing protein [Flavobacterium sp. LS1R47]|uniref:DUF1772 domain-containing protein n=1 Tax=Flavobacterium frigoritolerans TaxID=2987686 RepID=A0A9X3C1I5_9FLAO|nr:DUF1772 domain-containing protein [Flavobacterium frigoritolerans]MCV9933325.1 DUF1772 domain-containing protein [Flavobacterium frigoritolerans]